MATKTKFDVVPIDDEAASNIVAQYVDKDGGRLPQVREFSRTPGKVFGFWDDDDIVILDLNSQHPGAYKPQLPEKGTIFKVDYKGKSYVLDFSASSAKDRRLPLVNAEKRIAGRFMQHAEQSVYGQRMFLCSARLAVRGAFSVELKPEGFELPNGDIVADGMGYISQSLWDALIGKVPVRMTALDNQPRDSYQLYRMAWDTIREEAVPLLEESMAFLLADTANFYRTVLAGDDEKITLLGIEPEMIDHPLIVNAFTRDSRLAIAAKAYSVPFGESYWKIAMPVAMPAECGPVAFKRGSQVIGRYPFSSNAALRAYVVSAEVEKIYEERVAHRMGMQYSLVSLTEENPVRFAAKGMMIVVPDDCLDGDVLICDKDIKLGIPTKGKVAKRSKINVVDGYLGAIQVYDKGAFFGITPEEWIGFPGDFDGDGGVLYECSTFPSFWQAIADLPRSPVFKIVNSETRYSDKAVSIKAWQVMNSYLGQLSNIMSSTFAVDDRERLAMDMGFKSEKAMDDRLAYLLQIEVDRYKKNTSAALKTDMQRLHLNDPDRVMGKIVNFLENNLVTALSRMAPWTGWKRSEDVFRFFVPQIWNRELVPGSPEEEEAIPEFWNGTVAEILKITLPIMGEKLRLAATIRPLGYYYSWAPMVSPNLERDAKGLLWRFSAELRSVNTSDTNAVDIFKERWMTNVSLWKEATGCKTEALCAALWRASHSTDSQFASAIAPFWCFPAEARKIVEEKPGLEPVTSAKVIGLRKRMPDNGGPDVLENVEIIIEDVSIDETVNKMPRKRLLRVIRAEASQVPLNPAGIRKGYPQDYLGEIPYDAVTYLPTGRYVACFRRVSRGAWVAKLIKKL